MSGQWAVSGVSRWGVQSVVCHLPPAHPGMRMQRLEVGGRLAHLQRTADRRLRRAHLTPPASCQGREPGIQDQRSRNFFKFPEKNVSEQSILIYFIRAT